MANNFKAPKQTKPNNEETYFTWFLDDLVQNGFIEKYDRESEITEVLPPFSYHREVHYKEKENVLENYNLLPEITYTYDFRIIWTEKAHYVFTEVFQKNGCFRFNTPIFVSHYVMIDGVKKMASYVDVKPHYKAVQFGGGKMASYYTFPLIQKFLLHTRGLFINKIVPVNSGKNGVNTCLFAQTFTPRRYHFTDGGQQPRNIPFRKIRLESFLAMKQNMINELIRQNERKQQKNAQQGLF